MKISETPKRLLPISILKAVGRPIHSEGSGSNSALLDEITSTLADEAAMHNVAVLTGTVGERPFAVTGRSAQPALQLMLDHPAPAAAEPGKLAHTTVEVPHTLLANYPRDVKIGDTVSVIGKIAGEGELLATTITVQGSDPEDKSEGN